MFLWPPVGSSHHLQFCIPAFLCWGCWSGVNPTHPSPVLCLTCCVCVCCQEPSLGEKEAPPVPESSFKLLGSSDDLSSDSESHPTEEPVPLSPQQAFRRRANTLSHFPVEGQESLGPTQGSPGVSQRKLMRYHSLGTETPQERR